MTNPALNGKAAIVTGAGNGIGRAIATLFASAGASVLCADINSTKAEETAQMIVRASGRALAKPCDVSVEADVRAAAEAAQSAFGAIHVLVNAAATDDPNGTVLDITPAEWARVFAVNVMGAYLMSQAVLPMMIAAGGGNIIHIASQLGRVAAPGAGRLLCVKRRNHSACQSYGRGPCRAKYPGQFTITRRGRNSAASTTIRRYGNRTPRRRPQAPTKPAWPARRNRPGCPVSCQRCGELHDRRRHAGRRRLHGDLRLDALPPIGQGSPTRLRAGRACARPPHRPYGKTQRCAG